MNAAISGHGRNQERDADRIGIDYMTKAGYDPREAPITFELLLATYGDQPRLVNFFYGNHPANQERFDTLTALAKTTYAGDVASRRLIVNTEDFKRATRMAVIATGRLDYEESRFQSAKAMFDKAVRVWQDDPILTSISERSRWRPAPDPKPSTPPSRSSKRRSKRTRRTRRRTAIWASPITARATAPRRLPAWRNTWSWTRRRRTRTRSGPRSRN